MEEVHIYGGGKLHLVFSSRLKKIPSQLRVHEKNNRKLSNYPSWSLSKRSPSRPRELTDVHPMTMLCSALARVGSTPRCGTRRRGDVHECQRNTYPYRPSKFGDPRMPDPLSLSFFFKHNKSAAWREGSLVDPVTMGNVVVREKRNLPISKSISRNLCVHDPSPKVLSLSMLFFFGSFFSFAQTIPDACWR